MRRVTRRLFRYLVLPAAAGALWLSLPNRSEARPQYFETFKKTYEPLAEAAEEKRCAVCHGMGKKTERNHYGQAIVAALGDEKNVKDADAIEKALRTVEEKESGVEGKTFGDLIKEGKLPE
jgi:hypothetical protein